MPRLNLPRRLPRLLALALCIGLAAAAGPAGAAGPSRLAAELEQGDALLREGKIPAAAEAYRQAVQLDPQSAEAHYKLGVALGRMNQYVPAITQLEKARQLDPQNVQVLLTLASAYEFTNQVDKAVAAYQSIVANATSPALIADARKHIGLIKAKADAQQGRTDEALKRLRQLLDEQGEDAQVIYYMGVTLMLAKRPDEAEPRFKRVIELAPGNRSAYDYLVKIYEQRGDFAKAADTLQRLSKQIPPQSPQHRTVALQLALMKGRAALKAGDADKAMAAMQQALALDPANAFANYSIGIIREEEGRWPEAEQAFTKVLQVMPQNLDARLRLAAVFLRLNQVPRAVDQLRLLVKQAPNSPQGEKANELLERIESSMKQQHGGVGTAGIDAEIKRLEQQAPVTAEEHRRLGTLYLRKGEFKKAREQYQAVVKLLPDDEAAHGTLASIDENLNDFADAVDEYAITVSLDPNPERARGIARLLLLALGKRQFSDHEMKTALVTFGQVLAEEPQNPVALMYSGLIYSSESELEDAATAFQTVLRNNPNHLGARINLGVVYERLNQEDDAIREYRYILEQSPDSSIGEEAAKRLKMVEKRIKGLFTSMNYQMVYDSNSSLSAKATNEYRTDLNLNFSFRYKGDNDLRYTLTWAPSYSTYHVGHFDFLTNNFTVALSTVTARRTLSGGFSHAIQNSLSNSGRVSSSTTLFLESLESFRMPSVLNWDPDEPVDTSARFDFYYSDLNAGVSKFFSARTMSLGANISQFVDVRELLGLSYLYTRNRNKEDIGSDNAYDSHRVGITFQQGIGRGFAVNAGYNFFYYSYINPDSATNFTQQRRNISHLLTAGLTYSIAPTMSVYLNWFYQQNNSNLPVGFVFSTKDRAQNGLQGSTPGTPIGVQSTSLGDFSRMSLTAGLTWAF